MRERLKTLFVRQRVFYARPSIQAIVLARVWDNSRAHHLPHKDLAGGNGRLWAVTDLQAGYIHATIEIAKVMVIEGWPLEEAERLF